MDKHKFQIRFKYRYPFHLFEESILMLQNAGYTNIYGQITGPTWVSFPHPISSSDNYTHIINIDSCLWLISSVPIDTAISRILEKTTEQPREYDLLDYMMDNSNMIPEHNIIAGSDWMYVPGIIDIWKALEEDKTLESTDKNRFLLSLISTSCDNIPLDLSYKIQKEYDKLGGQVLATSVTVSVLRQLPSMVN